MIFETENGDSHGPQHPHADSVRPVGGLTGGGSAVSGPTPAAGGSPRQACFSRCADIWQPASHVSERTAAVIEGCVDGRNEFPGSSIKLSPAVHLVI